MSSSTRSPGARAAPKPGVGEPGVHAVLLLEEDREAARRLLALLSDSNGPRTGDRAQALARAKAALLLRHRRSEILGPRLSSEAPYSILLALYATDGAETGVTVTRLTQIATLRFSTALRWLEPLVAKGWIIREDDKDDGRRARVFLSDKSRDALDRLFSGAP